MQNHTQQQVHQFVRLLIDSQSEQLSPSERQSRLADAQRAFLELTEAQPEIAELIQAEWRNLHSGSESATESRRTNLISEIQNREQQLLTLTLQSQPISEWEIVRDSDSDPKVKSELISLRLKEHLKRKLPLKVPSVHLQNSDSSFSSFISVSQNGGLIEFDARAPNGHLAFVRGANAHPDGRIISWSSDTTLILWKLADDIYVVDQRLGEDWNSDPNKGHTNSVYGAQVFPDGTILSWSADQTLILWKWVNGTYAFDQRLGEALKLNQQRDPNKGHTGWVRGARVLPDGKILSWSDDHTLIIWRPVNSEYVIDQRLGQISNSDPQKGHTVRVRDARVLHDGRILSSDTSDRDLLWRITYPSAIQTEIESLSKELDSLKTALTRLEARRSSSEDISEAGGL